jgi:predicted aspartyl protease
MRIALLISIGLLGAYSAASAQGMVNPVPASPPAIDSATQTENVRFREDGFDRMTVPVRVSGVGPYRFLVDTGADRTAISRELAGALKLQTGQGASLHTLTGRSHVGTAIVGSLQLTRERVAVADAAVLDRSDIGADGILGVDTLRRQRVLFDFEARTLSIVPSAIRESKPDRGSIVVRARRKNGRLVISEAQVNDHRTTVVVDTGAQVSIGNLALRRKLFGDRPIDPAATLNIVTVTGQPATGEFVFVEKLVLGGMTIRNLGILFTDAHTFQALDLRSKPAMLLGMNAMRAFKKLSIDFAAKKIRVVLPEESSLEHRLATSLPSRRG